jgi:S-adenosylmethionine synthetase
MSLEATAGKNPVSHAGKIYNVLAMNIAETVYKEIGGIREGYVKILSQIGKPIDQPLTADVEILLEKNVTLHKVRGDIEGIVDEQLANIKKITEAIIEGKATLF